VKRNLKIRRDLDDGDETPAFVTEPIRNVPVCCRCGCEVPQASTRWTLCASCQVVDLPGLTLALPRPRPPGGTHEVIAALAKQFVATLPDRGPTVAVLSPAIVTHQARLQARGLDAHAALRLAEAMVVDPDHRATCAICGRASVDGARDERRR
jgi:hypothetical protein